MAESRSTPATMNALILKGTSEPPTVEVVPTPRPGIGSAVIKVEAANIISYMREVYNGARAYTLPTPMVPGTSFIGHVAEVGADATKIKPGDLVLVDCFIRGRDDSSVLFLAGLHDGFSPGSKKLMRDVYRDWAWADYCLAPLENLHLLNEDKLLGSKSNGGFGYRLGELCFINSMTVPYGGFREIDLKPGETIIIAPATGPFGGAAVVVALAMGARVIAMGRNKDTLAKLKARFPERLETVPITGDAAADAAALQQHGTIDACWEMGPPEAVRSTHLRSCLLALRHGGRIALMSGYREDVSIPYVIVVHKNLKLFGKWMYEQSDIADLIKLIESGMLKLGEAVGSRVVGSYPLDQWKQALDTAWDKNGMGEMTVFAPHG